MTIKCKTKHRFRAAITLLSLLYSLKNTLKRRIFSKIYHDTEIKAPTITIAYIDHKSLAYTSLMRPSLEYGEVCWDPHRGADVRLGAKQSGKICTSQEWFKLENLGTAQNNSWQMCPLQSVHRRTGLKGYRLQITKAMLSEQNRSW
jgi:hypothetical protein